MEDLKNTITAFVRSSKNGIIGLKDLGTLLQDDNGSLKQAVGGIKDVLDLIRKWRSDLLVIGSGMRATIFAIKTDPIFDLNNQS